jgi:putative phosphoribosyl transferase
VVFANRKQAGALLAERLSAYRDQDVVVLGLPRGGVPVAAEVAEALGAPLDVIAVRKLGVPFQPEVAMGAIGEGGATVREPRVLAEARISEEEFARVEARERTAMLASIEWLRRGRDRIDLTGRVAIVVDDGMATGSTARVACVIARQLGAVRVVLAVPCGPPEVLASFSEADEVVAVLQPENFLAVGYHYRDFSPTSDAEVITALDAASRRMGLLASAARPPDCDIDVEIQAGEVVLSGHLHLPEPSPGVVVFAHGSGSSRHSPRNRYVASVLYEAGIGTLLLDLLTQAEERDRANVFDIELLAHRLVLTTRWLKGRPETAASSVGYFGASTGAGAALWAAAEEPDGIGAVVSRGGRPDLAGDRLARVRAPTLLIVGSADTQVVELNRQALGRLTSPSQLVLVPGASHLFEEPGTLAEAANLARDWFVRHLLGEGALAKREAAP